MTPGGCILWTKSKTLGGYGKLRVGGVLKLAHRVEYEKSKGSIPEGYQIDHLCKNPSCVNPDHLEAVTPLENFRRSSSGAVTRARHAAKTHCKNGHVWENQLVARDGTKQCRQCNCDRARAWMRRKRGTTCYPNSK